MAGLGCASVAGGWASVLNAAANKDPVKLLLGSHMDYLMKLLPAYEGEFGVLPSVEQVTTPDLAVKLNSSMIARRSPGDAVFVTAALVAGLADKGWLSDLTDLVEDKLLPNGLIPNSVTAANYKSRAYGVPITIGCPIMHWNKNLCEAAGLDPEAPSGWHATPIPGQRLSISPRRSTTRTTMFTESPTTGAASGAFLHSDRSCKAAAEDFSTMTSIP